MSEPSTLGDLAEHFLLLNTYLQAGGTTEVALQRLVDLAVSTVPGCDWAAVTSWPENRQPKSVAASHQIAADADRRQYALAEGPCLTASADAAMVLIADLASDHRWPRFASEAIAGTPVRAVLSFHLSDDPQRCALNMYSGQGGGFDDEAVGIGALFAAHARVLLIHAASAGKAANLETALTTSRQIGAAVGVLMNVHRVTADQAFELLRNTSQRLNRKLRDVAFHVTETGILPEDRR